MGFVTNTQLKNNNTVIKNKLDKKVDVRPITDPSTTLADVNEILADTNASGEHVLFDVATLGASAYLCLIYIDNSDNPTFFKIFDLVKVRVISGTYDGTLLLTEILANANDVADQFQIADLQDQINKIKHRNNMRVFIRKDHTEGGAP